LPTPQENGYDLIPSNGMTERELGERGVSGQEGLENEQIYRSYQGSVFRSIPSSTRWNTEGLCVIQATFRQLLFGRVWRGAVATRCWMIQV